MRFKIMTLIPLSALLLAFCAPIPVLAQQYKVINLGEPLGGTASAAQGINDGDWIGGDASFPGDLTEHAVLWHDGKVIDLGTLGGLNSAGGPVTNSGLAIGDAQMPTVDPLGENWGLIFVCTPSGGSCDGYQNLVRGFVWQHDVMTSLPTLGGNNSFAGFSQSANSRGQVVGFAENARQDPSCIAPQVLDFEAVIWGPGTGEIRELRPFPGDSIGVAFAINDNGQVAGGSGFCAFPNISDATHAVLWEEDGSVADLGTLGGAVNNFAWGINNHGEVVGQSDLLGDSSGHAFLWTRDRGMQDLGTLPGDVSSVALGINRDGEVVVESCDVNGNCRVALWQDGIMRDLNSLTPPGSLYMVSAFAINDYGEVVGWGCVVTDGVCGPEQVAFLAFPCNEKSACDGTCDCASNAAAGEKPKPIQPDSLRKLSRQQRAFARR